MLITRATDYALRLLMMLSNSAPQRLKVVDLAAGTAVPKAYVPKVIAPLVHRGWVHAYRGARGGFALDGRARDLTLLEVVELFQGPLHLQPCTSPAGCPFRPRCPAHCVWAEAEAGLSRVLRNYRIGELAEASQRQELFVPPQRASAPQEAAGTSKES